MPEFKKIASPEELETAAELIRRSFSTVAEEFGFTPENAAPFPAFIKAEKLAKNVSDGLNLFFLFDTESGTPAGTIGYKVLGSRRFTLERLAVLPEHRHKKYGETLVKFVEDFVKSAGGGTIELGTVFDNTRLVDWYIRLGYHVTETKRYDGLIFTVGLMEKEI